MSSNFRYAEMLRSQGYWVGLRNGLVVGLICGFILAKVFALMLHNI